MRSRAGTTLLCLVNVSNEIFVSISFGEHKGSYCLVAKLRDGRQENFVDAINFVELEQKSAELSKQVGVHFS